MRIILGIYKTSLYLLDSFPFLEKFPFGLEPHSDPAVLIKKAIQKATKIVFCLDGLKFPINYKIYTYMELLIIAENPKFLKKTQFILDGIVIKRELVIEQLKNKNEGAFENLKPEKVKQTGRKARSEVRTERQLMNAKRQRSRQQRNNNKKGKVIPLFP